MSSPKAPATQTITTKTDSAPWVGAQPYLQQAMGAASNQFNMGPQQYFPGQTVAGFSAPTMTGMGMIARQAGQGDPWGQQGGQALSRAMQPNFAPGFGNAARTAMGGQSNPWAGTAGGIANGSNPYLGQIGASAQANPVGGAAAQGLMNQAATPYANQAAGMFGRTTDTSGLQGFLQPGPNPYLDDMFSQAQRQVTNAVNAQFSGAGRYGSAAHTGALTQGLGDLATNIYASAYEADRQRQFSAAQALPQFQQADYQRDLQSLAAAGDLAGQAYQNTLAGAQFGADIYNQDRTRQLQAGQIGLGAQLDAARLGGGFFADDQARALDAFGGLQGAQQAQNALGLTAVAALPGFRSYQQSGARDLMGIGQMLEQQRQAEINADIARWDYNQRAPRENIEWLNAVASGQGQLGGTSSQIGQQPYQRGNPFLGALGGAAGGAGVASLLGASGPVGWGLAGLGALGGLF